MTSWRDRFHVVPAVYVILEREGQILLLKRANTGYLDGLYSLPAGHLDGGEPASNGAARELFEEVGLSVEPSQLEFVHILHRRALEGDHERMDLFYRVRNLTADPINAEPGKCAELRWAAYDSLPSQMVPEVAHVIECVNNGVVYSDYNF